LGLREQVPPEQALEATNFTGHNESLPNALSTASAIPENHQSPESHPEPAMSPADMSSFL